MTTEPTAEPPAETPVTVQPDLRAAAARSVQAPADPTVPAPPPAPPPQLVVVAQPEPPPGPAGTPLFWERRRLTRRARIAHSRLAACFGGEPLGVWPARCGANAA